MLLLLWAVPAAAQREIDFDPAITQEEFRKFARLVGQGIYASPVQPAGAAGLLRFDVGIAVTAVEIDSEALYWRRAVQDEDLTIAGDYVGVPRLVVSKGLGGGAIAGTYARLNDSDIEMWGGALDVPIIRGGLLRPTLALRGTYSQLRGVDVFDLKTYGVELFLGKGFGPITPYGGVGRMRTDAQGRVPSIGLTLEDESDLNRYTVGARLSLGLLKFVVEASQAEERNYAAKLSAGF